MADRLRVAVVGAGRMGRRHAENLAAGARSRVTWIVDPAEAVARPLAARCGAEWTADLSVALGAADVDAVVIATPSTLHAAAVKTAVAAGKAIFCEKPLVVGLAPTHDLVSRIEHSGLYFQIGFMRRYDPGYVEARRAAAAGDLGHIRHALAISRDPLPPPEDYIAGSGGIFLDLGIHDIDLLRHLVGDDVVRVHAQGNVGETAYLAAHDDAEEAQVLLQFAGGATATMLMSRSSLYGYDIRTELWGTKGSLAVGYLRDPAVTHYDRSGLHSLAVPGFLERFATAYRLEMEDFTARVLAGEPSPAPAADALAAAEVAEACRQSFLHGATVDVTEVRG